MACDHSSPEIASQGQSQRSKWGRLDLKWRQFYLLLRPMSVCMSVCSHVRDIYRSSELHGQTSPNFLSMLPMAIAVSFPGGAAIRYVLPVLWMTSCMHIMARDRRREKVILKWFRPTSEQHKWFRPTSEQHRVLGAEFDIYRCLVFACSTFCCCVSCWSPKSSSRRLLPYFEKG